MENWRSLLQVTKGERGGGRPIRCIENVMVALRHCPDWEGVLAYNQFTDRRELLKPPPRAANQGEGKTGSISDSVVHSMAWCHQALGFEPSHDMMYKAMATAALENTHHPVRQYLTNLRWDGIDRCDSMVANYFGGGDTEINRNIGAKWMIGAVARIMQPGCQVDHIMVLEGPQGGRKSTALRTLVGEDWFRNTTLDMRSKDAAMALRGCWVYEFDELESMRGREAARVKAFLTRRTDSFRPAYERDVVDVARQCCFVGSTNEDRYLVDATGNRRYWPVKVGVIDVQRLASDRDQLWAESVHRYSLGEKWYIDDPELLAQFTQLQSEREEEDPWDEPIAAWWGRMHEERQAKGVTVSEAFAQLELRVGNATKSEQIRMSNVFKRLGLERHQRRLNGVKTMRWYPVVPGV